MNTPFQFERNWEMGARESGSCPETVLPAWCWVLEPLAHLERDLKISHGSRFSDGADLGLPRPPGSCDPLVSGRAPGGVFADLADLADPPILAVERENFGRVEVQ